MLDVVADAYKPSSHGAKEKKKKNIAHFQTGLNYTASSKPSRATKQDPISKQNKKSI